ncbi:hypothetical protein [Flavisolibacter tropicus]|uniref:DUF4595 domain-containing protein n=1 Tax=Flavisolibacter tropicus TaxID=1492898 RepID=A0A172TZ33_9BACT|nr:hypothetical protein [Flavisolibacter tropicus]ANE52134.1 hypothetical protein SY85_18200 [Flavisolibacter tropicus]
MKRAFSVLLLLISCTVLLSNCKKDKEDINTDEVRLQAVETKQSNGDIHKLFFDYDANGRIIKIRSGRNNETPTTNFIITYSGNEILIPVTVSDDELNTIKDTIRLLLNADQQVIKRMYHGFHEFKAPTFTPQRTNIYDTTTYSYDAAGLVKQETHGGLDTSWYNPGVETIMVSRTAGFTNYSIKDGNIISTKKEVTSSGYAKQGGIVSTGKSSNETTHAFEYAKAYPNKIDFKNAAILNELQLVFPPINKNLRNVPEKILVTDITKNGNGNITSSNSFTINQELSYNKYGFVNIRFDPASPTLKTTYVYNK